MTYRATFRPQLGDPTTTLDGYLCSMESGAMALDFTTGGGVKVWGGTLASHCGKTADQIRAHGTNLVDVARALAYYGQTLDNRTGETWADAEAELNAGRFVVLQGVRLEIPYANRCGRGFTGHHAVAVTPERSGTKRLWGDPLCASWTWIESSYLRAFAEALGQLYLGTIESRQPIFFGSVAPKAVVVNAPSGGLGDMATRYAPRLSSPRVMHLAKGTPLYDRPGGQVITHMSKDADLPYLGWGGKVGGLSWRQVQVTTGWSYPTGSMYPTNVYALDSAGRITSR